MHNRWIVCLLTVQALAVLPASAGQPRPKLEIPAVTKDQIICFALYTVSNNVLKLTAQLYPLEVGDERTVWLEIKREGKWAEVARTQ